MNLVKIELAICLRAWLHMASHYTRGPVTMLRDFGGVLGWPLHIPILTRMMQN